MATSDDDRFRPDDTSPDDYPVGEGYRSAPPPSSESTNPFPESSLTPPPPVVDPPTPAAPVPGPSPYTAATWQARPGLPYGATSDPATPSPQRPLAPPPGSGANPYLGGPAPARGRRRGSWIPLAFVAGVVVALWLLGAVLGAIQGSDDGYPPPGTSTPVPGIDTAWVVTPSDIDPAGGELVLGIDGAFTGASYVDAGDTLVVAHGTTYRDATAIAGLDATTGEVLWNRELAGVLCGDQAYDGAVACLASDGGTWTFHRIDVRTGEDLATAATGLTAVETVHTGPDGLVAVGPADPAPHAVVAGFDLDGAERWSFDVAEVDGAEYLFDDFLATDLGGQGDDAEATMERPRWRDLDGGLMMLWVTPGVAVIDPATGETFVHECLRATPAHDRYYCQDDAGINRRDLDGEVVWSLPDLQLAYVADTSDARPVAVSQRYELVPVDWETGEVTGAAYYRFDPQPGGFTGTIMGPSAIGDAQAQYLEQDGERVVRLVDDRDDVAWDYLSEDYVDGVATLDDVTVLLGFNLAGLDADTGELLWERRNDHGIYTYPHDGSLIGIGFDEIARLELP